MFIDKKIFIRLSLLSGIGYLIYRNKDKIIGKIDKLSRMDSVDEAVDDLSITASNALNGAVGMVDEMYEYVSNLGSEIESGINMQMQNEINKEVLNLPVNHAFQLKKQAFNLVSDIKEWRDEGVYSDIKYEEGKMPAPVFINWYNFLTTKNSDYFNKVKNMVEIYLQYDAPNVKKDAVPNTSLPNLSYHISNAPKNYFTNNQIDWKGRGAFTDMKPIELFNSLSYKLRGNN